jgi:hypothetical protein
MILYQLKCSDGHEFEAWFRDSDSYGEQIDAEAISCPTCGDTGVSKAPMAPNLATRSGRGASSEDRMGEVAREMRQAVEGIRQAVEENCDYVGDGFADEARRIHYGESEPRDIYGEATNEESSDLDDEGIEHHRLPGVPRRNS